MTHRSVIRLFSAALLAVLVLGCDDESNPTDPGGPFLVVTPSFAGPDPGETVQLAATMGGSPVAVTWSTNNAAAATVSATGLVTAVAGGFAAVTAALSSDATVLRSASINVATLVGTAISNGVPVANLSSSGARGSGVLYRIFVPAGRASLTVTLRGGSGDADIYVQRQTPPTNAGANATGCNSFNSGNDEDCVITAPASGSWYILIDLWDPYAGATLTATYAP